MRCDSAGEGSRQAENDRRTRNATVAWGKKDTEVVDEKVRVKVAATTKEHGQDSSW